MISSNLVRFVLVASILRSVSSQRYRRKFDFFPGSEGIWGIHLRGPANESYNEWNAQAPLCEDIYSGYLNALMTFDPKIGDYIYNTSDCILSSCSTFQTQTIQSSSVLLGLAPILLSTTGPSLTEIALISIQRPVLAVLLSLGTAAIYPTRAFSSYDDRPRDVLVRNRPSSLKLLDRLFHRYPMSDRKSRVAHVLFGMLEYILVAGAVANTLYTSWQLSTSTIFVLVCPQSWFPLVWSLLPLIVHALVCGSFHYHLHAFKNQKKSALHHGNTSDRTNENSERPEGSAIALLTLPNDSATRSDSQEPGVSRKLSQHGADNLSPTPGMPWRSDHEHDVEAIHGWKPSTWELHLVPACEQPTMAADFLDNAPFVVDLSHKIGTILAFAQVIYGVIIFSSLLFISAGDAAAILLRYLASVVLCRVLIAVELGYTRFEDAKKKTDRNS